MINNTILSYQNKYIYNISFFKKKKKKVKKINIFTIYHSLKKKKKYSNTIIEKKGL